jgi:fructosamine-3-kinase
MSGFALRVAELAGVEVGRLERLSGGDLSDVLLVRRPNGHLSVAKGGPSIGSEAGMLRAIAGAGVSAPAVEAEHEDVLLLEHVANDGVFSAKAWADIGAEIARLHRRIGEDYGWPVDHKIGSVHLDNRQRRNGPLFWGAQRLVSTAALLDRPWRERVDCLAARLGDLLPASPPPSLLHGDLWSGNILVNDGRLAAFIDPACYHGDKEVDLAMLTLFGTPPQSFWHGYGELEPDWRERVPLYQLFPALVHLRLFGATYAPLVDRLLSAVGG